LGRVRASSVAMFARSPDRGLVAARPGDHEFAVPDLDALGLSLRGAARLRGWRPRGWRPRGWPAGEPQGSPCRRGRVGLRRQRAGSAWASRILSEASRVARDARATSPGKLLVAAVGATLWPHENAEAGAAEDFVGDADDVFAGDLGHAGVEALLAVVALAEGLHSGSDPQCNQGNQRNLGRTRDVLPSPSTKLAWRETYVGKGRATSSTF
jgi:hypothetical protein